MRVVTGPLIKAERIAYRDSRELTGLVVGKTTRTVEAYETGQIIPPANVLAALADRYGVPIDSFYSDVEADPARLAAVAAVEALAGAR